MAHSELRPQISPEVEREQQEKVGWHRRRLAALGLVAATGMAAYAALDNYDGQSGEVRDYSVAADAGPIIEGTEETIVAAGEDGVAEDELLTAEGSPADDGVLRVVTWNMHKETGQEQRLEEIKSLLYEQGADAVLLQEVRAERAKKLGKYLPGLEVRHVVGEAFPGKGELGNVIITWEEQQDVDSITLDGSSMLGTARNILAGVRRDVQNKVTESQSDGKFWKETDKGWEENRAAIRLVIKVRVGDEIRTVRIANMHLSHRESDVKERQLRQLDNYTEDTPNEIDIDILCGDFNEADYAKTAQVFDQFLVLETGPTFEKYGTTIDRCMLRPVEGLSATAKTLKKYKTDHTAVEAVLRQEGYEHDSEDIVADSTEIGTIAPQN